MLDRREENLVTGHRAPSIQQIKIGARRDGTLTAIQLDGICQVGAYGAWAPALAGPFKEIYACPNVQTTVIGVRTNTDTMVAFRAPATSKALSAWKARWTNWRSNSGWTRWTCG